MALDQLAYARGWFATHNVVGVRKELEDGVQAVLSGKATPEAAMACSRARPCWTGRAWSARSRQ